MKMLFDEEKDAQAVVDAEFAKYPALERSLVIECKNCRYFFHCSRQSPSYIAALCSFCMPVPVRFHNDTDMSDEMWKSGFVYRKPEPWTGKQFVESLLAGRYAECSEALLADESLARRMTWDAMSCHGGWGLPMYRRMGYLLQEGLVGGGDVKFRALAVAIARKAFPSDEEAYIDVVMAYALASDQHCDNSCWAETLRECIRSNAVPLELKATFAHQPRTPAMCAVWATFGAKEEEEEELSCCICLDAACDAYFVPCAHTQLCFACARDLSVCPICRSEGYAKPQLKK